MRFEELGADDGGEEGRGGKDVFVGGEETLGGTDDKGKDWGGKGARRRDEKSALVVGCKEKR